MGRRYSKVSNYSIGQFVRMFVFAIAGFFIGWIVLPRFFHFQTQDQLALASFVGAVVCALFAKKYT